MTVRHEIEAGLKEVLPHLTLDGPVTTQVVDAIERRMMERVARAEHALVRAIMLRHSYKLATEYDVLTQEERYVSKIIAHAKEI
jgi:hypothetical protein